MMVAVVGEVPQVFGCEGERAHDGDSMLFPGRPPSRVYRLTRPPTICARPGRVEYKLVWDSGRMLSRRTSMSRWSDVLVVGGGVIGGALAWALARRGLSVTIVEGGRIGRGASWAAAGVLSPDWSGTEPPALSALAQASLELWADWAGEIEEATGVGL